MPRFFANDGRRHGPPERLLTEVELSLVKTLATKGCFLNASFAKALGVSISLWKVLKHERQPEEIGEALAEGHAALHDGLFSTEASIALDPKIDVRERRAATEYLLSCRFGYRPKGSEQSVNIEIGEVGGRGPQLTIVQEAVDEDQLRAMAQALALRADMTDSMVDGEVARQETGDVRALCAAPACVRCS